MVALLQRASEGKVTVEGRVTGEIGKGLVILLGVKKGDTEEDADFLADKAAGFRIFSDENGKMNLSIRDVGGAALVISQFTLCGDWQKGRRPGFDKAAPPEEAKRLYDYFCGQLRKLEVPVETGEFGTMMNVSLVNEGPVTFVMDSRLGS